MAGPKLTYTSPAVVAAAFAIGCGAMYMALSLAHSWGGAAPRTPLAAAVALAAAAGLLLVLAIVKLRHRRTLPRAAVTLLALGRAAALAGGALAGAYTVLAVDAWPRLAAEYPRERLASSLVSLVGAVVLVAAGYLLQRALHVDDDDPDQPSAHD
ncbi:MAG: DUF3180 family protein [Propionibacteriaceae bacterium]|jgi:hypothetical protein|nr:DUF3180 family protein [Propionibacteriaceae bacterium]